MGGGYEKGAGVRGCAAACGGCTHPLVCQPHAPRRPCQTCGRWGAGRTWRCGGRPPGPLPAACCTLTRRDPPARAHQHTLTRRAPTKPARFTPTPPPHTPAPRTYTAPLTLTNESPPPLDESRCISKPVQCAGNADAPPVPPSTSPSRQKRCGRLRSSPWPVHGAGGQRAAGHTG